MIMHHTCTLRCSLIFYLTPPPPSSAKIIFSKLPNTCFVIRLSNGLTRVAATVSKIKIQNWDIVWTLTKLQLPNFNCGNPDSKVSDDLKNVFVVVVNEFDKFAEWIPLSLSYFLTDYNLRIALNDKNKSQIDFFSTLQMKQFI